MTARAILIATTVLYRQRIADDTPYVEHEFPSDVETVLAADELAELAGRACYASWDRPNPTTATNRGYLRNILMHEHYSVLEHASATFYVDGISRACSHELVRHRHLSFSQLSQRYVNATEYGCVIPPNMRGDGDWQADIEDHFESSLSLYDDFVAQMESSGYSRKEAREAARAVLPNSTETALVVTGNMRAWRGFIAKRMSPGADAEIRDVATLILRELRGVAPNTFQDMPPMLRPVPDDGPIGTAVFEDKPEPVAA